MDKFQRNKTKVFKLSVCARANNMWKWCKNPIMGTIRISPICDI